MNRVRVRSKVRKVLSVSVFLLLFFLYQTPLAHAATLSGGTEGYGLNAQINSGAQTISAPYAHVVGNDVGAFSRSATTLSSYNLPTPSNQVTNWYVKAAISAGTAAGTYADTLTFLATGNS